MMPKSSRQIARRPAPPARTRPRALPPPPAPAPSAPLSRRGDPSARRHTALTVALLLVLLALLTWALAPRSAWAGGADCAALAATPGAVTLRAGGDLIVMAPHASAAAQVCYQNGNNVSRQGDYALTLDTLTVQFFLDVGAEETLHVRPPLGYMVFPADAAEARVHDGGQVTLLIVMGVS